MTNLLQARDVRGVDLQVSEQAEIGGTTVTRFTLHIAMPDLGLSAAQPAKPVNQIKRGGQAAKQARNAEAKAQKEASK
jgi:hypothetical protein